MNSNQLPPSDKAKELMRKVDDTVCGDIKYYNAVDMVCLIADECIASGSDADYWNQVQKEARKLLTSNS